MPPAFSEGMDVSLGVAGSITIVAVVGLGIFVYPWLLVRKGGVAAIAAATIALALAFFYFDRARGTSAEASGAFALILALVPVVVGVIARRFTR